MSEPTPEPAPDAPPPAVGPACTLCGIAGGPDVWLGHWQRRLTPDEIAAHQQLEQNRRDEALLLADPDQPPPDFGPMPDGADWTRVVFGCVDHAIDRDAAALIHQATCSAPPTCDCTPEPVPTPTAPPEPPPAPPGW